MAGKWVYDVLMMLKPINGSSIVCTEQALNAVGEEGWELVSTQPGLDGWTIYFLKKPG